MKKFLTVFAILGLAFCVSTVSASAAEEGVDDGFGTTFFTAATPDALQDNGASDMMLSGADDALAEELGNIAPAAGGEDLFILPTEDDASVSVNPGSEELASPAVAPVPGMDPAPIQ